jgi:hypothetical protein
MNYIIPGGKSPGDQSQPSCFLHKRDARAGGLGSRVLGGKFPGRVRQAGRTAGDGLNIGNRTKMTSRFDCRRISGRRGGGPCLSYVTSRWGFPVERSAGLGRPSSSSGALDLVSTSRSPFQGRQAAHGYGRLPLRCRREAGPALAENSGTSFRRRAPLGVGSRRWYTPEFCRFEWERRDFNGC